MKSVLACRPATVYAFPCINRYTHICISYNIWTWIENSHILYNTLSCQRDFLMYLEVQIYIQLLIKTADTEDWMKRASSHMHLTLPVWAICCRANTNTQCTVAEGQLVKTNTHTDTFPAAPTLSQELRNLRYWYFNKQIKSNTTKKHL